MTKKITSTSIRGNHTDPNTCTWTTEEHARFIDGLEKFGVGQSSNVNAAWHAIASAVRTRTLNEVKNHANWYFLQLQKINSQKRKEYLMMQNIDSRWSHEEDAIFEQLLGIYSSGISYPWDIIASKIPGKSAKDVKDRYHKLCYDVSRIENGHQIVMNLGRFTKRQLATSNGNDEAVENDCTVTLTLVEEQILMSALENVHIVPGTHPDVLAAVAAAVSYFANSKNKLPPTRTNPLFSSDEARMTIENLFCLGTTQTYQILEELVMSLHIHPYFSEVRNQEDGSFCVLTGEPADNFRSILLL